MSNANYSRITAEYEFASFGWEKKSSLKFLQISICGYNFPNKKIRKILYKKSAISFCRRLLLVLACVDIILVFFIIFDYGFVRGRLSIIYFNQLISFLQFCKEKWKIEQLLYQKWYKNSGNQISNAPLGSMLSAKLDYTCSRSVHSFFYKAVKKKNKTKKYINTMLHALTSNTLPELSFTKYNFLQFRNCFSFRIVIYYFRASAKCVNLEWRS